MLTIQRCTAALRKRTRRLGEVGAGLIEYVLLVALIALVTVAAVTYFGTSTCDKLEDIPESGFNTTPPNSC